MTFLISSERNIKRKVWRVQSSIAWTWTWTLHFVCEKHKLKFLGIKVTTLHTESIMESYVTHACCVWSIHSSLKRNFHVNVMFKGQIGMVIGKPKNKKHQKLYAFCSIKSSTYPRVKFFFITVQLSWDLSVW